MSSSENEKLVAWTKFSMILGGTWGSPITKNPILEVMYLGYTIFVQVGFFLMWLSLVVELLRLIIYKYELPIIIESLGVACNASKIMAKVVIYWKFNIAELFPQVIETEKIIWTSKNEKIIKMYKGMIKACQFYFIFLAASTVATIIMLETVGAIATINLRDYNVAHNTSLEPHFMYQSILPLNKFQHLYWTFSLQVFFSYVAGVLNCVTHSVFFTLLVYTASRLKSLQIKLRDFLGFDFTDCISKEQMDEKIQVLKALIRDHQDVIAFVKHFNKCTKYIVMMEFVLSSLDIASVSANLIKREANFSWLLTFFVLLIIQISLIGWTSNEIKVQSEAIADAAFESEWYLLNKEGKVLIQLMIIRAQKPLVMTIGPLGPMTLTTVLMIFKAAYSYVSIMKE